MTMRSLVFSLILLGAILATEASVSTPYILPQVYDPRSRMLRFTLNPLGDNLYGSIRPTCGYPGSEVDFEWQTNQRLHLGTGYGGLSILASKTADNAPEDPTQVGCNCNTNYAGTQVRVSCLLGADLPAPNSYVYSGTLKIWSGSNGLTPYKGCSESYVGSDCEPVAVPVGAVTFVPSSERRITIWRAFFDGAYMVMDNPQIVYNSVSGKPQMSAWCSWYSTYQGECEITGFPSTFLPGELYLSAGSMTSAYIGVSIPTISQASNTYITPGVEHSIVFTGDGLDSAGAAPSFIFEPAIISCASVAQGAAGSRQATCVIARPVRYNGQFQIFAAFDGYSSKVLASDSNVPGRVTPSVSLSDVRVFGKASLTTITIDGEGFGDPCSSYCNIYIFGYNSIPYKPWFPTDYQLQVVNYTRITAIMNQDAPQSGPFAARLSFAGTQTALQQLGIFVPYLDTPLYSTTSAITEVQYFALGVLDGITHFTPSYHPNPTSLSTITNYGTQQGFTATWATPLVAGPFSVQVTAAGGYAAPVQNLGSIPLVILPQSVTLTRQHTGTISIRGFGFGGSFVTSMLDITFSNGMTCIFSQLEATGGVGTTPGEYICRVGALPKWLGAFTVTVGVRGLVTSGAIAMGTIIADPTIPMSTSRPIATNTEEIEVLGTNFGGNPSVSFSPITCASITKSDGKITCAPNTIPTSLIGSLLNVTVAREDGAQTVYKMPATYCKVGHESFSQNKTFVMQCPAGGSIATINFADYGTPSGSCATGYSSNSMCTSTTTVNPIVAACVGQNSCSFDISNEQFGGDPCEMTPKYFVAQYTCDFGCTEDCFDHVPVGVFVAPPTIKSGPSHIVPNAPSIKFNVEGTLYGPHQVTLSSGAFNEPCTISDSTSSGSGIDFTCTTPTGIPVGAPLTIKFVDTGSGGVATHVIGSVVSAASVYDQSRSIATLATTITLTGSNFFGEPSAFDISINDVLCLVHDITSTSLLCDLADPAPALGNPGTAVIVTGTMFGGAFTASIGTLVASHSIEPGNVAASRTDITQLIILGDNIPPENDFTIHLSVFVAARNLTFNDGVCQVVSVNSTAIVCNAGPFLYVGTLYVSLRAYSYDAVQPFGQIVPSPVLRFSGKVAHNSQYFVIQGQDLYSTVTPSVYIYVLADDPAFPNGQDWQAAVDSSYPVYTPPTVVEAYGPTNISITTELTANHVNSMVIARVVVTTVSSKVIWARVMTVTNPPTVTASSSKFAATATLISITGTGFDDTGAPTSVMLTTEAGSITCGNVVVTSSTSLTCQPVSSLGSGPVSAEVTSYGGASAIVAIGTVVPDPELQFQPSMLRSQNAGFIRFVGSNLPIPGEESSIAIEFASSSSTCSKITAVSTTEILCERAPGSTWTSGPLYATISVYGKSFVAQQVATVVAPPSISSSAGSTRVLVGATELTISGSGFSGGSSKRADGDDIHVYLILPSATEPPTCTVKTVTADVIVCETAGISSEGTLSAIINAHGGNSSQVDVATVSGSSAVVAGAAAGGAIGGVVALALIIVAIIFLVRRNKRQAKVNRAERFRRAATNQSLQEMAAQESSRYSKWSVPHDEIEFGKEIGKGAFGKVYEGTWRGQKVAIKEALITDPTARADFFKEAELMLGLEPHPNVVRIYGVSVVSETSMCYIIMERLYGSFDKILFNPASHSQLKDTDMIEFARGICSGMDHVSNHGIVHRDLASRNILMAKDGTPKISDFGLSRKVSDAATAGTTASNVGPIQWMSPENINREYSSKSDVWSYGCVVYEIVAGQEPHSGRAADLLSLALEIRDNYITPGIPDNSPPVLRNVMEASWKPTPDERASFSELCKLLR